MSIAIHINLAPYAQDDAFIHMRIARNLIEHGRPYYNLDDGVMASTAPLWIILTAPLALLGSNQPYAVAALNAILSVATSIMGATAMRRFFPSTRGLPVSFSSIPFFCALLWSSVGLMETPFAVLLIVTGALWLHGSSRWWALPFAAALFVRPETCCFGAAALIAARRRPRLPAELLPAALVSAIILLSEYCFFGSIVPHTVQVKSIVYQLSTAESFRSLLFAIVGESGTRIAIFSAIVFSIAAIATITTARSDDSRGELRMLAIVTLPGVCIGAAYVMRGVLVFPWYAPLVTIPATTAALWCGASPRRAIRGLGLSILYLSFSTGIMTVAGTFNLRMFDQSAAGGRVRTFRAIGSVLQQTAPTAKVLAAEIGGIGFEFRGNVLDGVGLATPRALAFHPLSIPVQRAHGSLGAIPIALAKESAPDVIIALENLTENELRNKHFDGYDRIELPIFLPEDSVVLGNPAQPRVTLWGNEHILLYLKHTAPNRDALIARISEVCRFTPAVAISSYE